MYPRIADTTFNVVRLETDRMNNTEFIILNIYTPYESRHNDNEYVNRLAFMNSFIADNCCTTIYVTGDMNADISDNASSFAKHMIRMCEDLNLVLFSQVLLPADSFTHYSVVPTQQLAGLII